MKENYSILLLGEMYDNHMNRFVRNLKYVNPKVEIDCFTPSIKEREITDDYLACFRECRIEGFSHLFQYVPYLRKTESRYNWKKHFRAFSKGRRYDIVNIHYPKCSYYSILNELKGLSNNLVLTPWGSDVLRINNQERAVMKHLYDAADYVTGYRGRFTDDFMRIYNIPQNKLVYAFIGSETIDYIMEHKSQIDVDSAKKVIGLDGYYVISCGYNASPVQQHHQIVEAIKKVRSSLPEQLALLFPLTYPKNTEYIGSLKTHVSNMGVKALFFDHYMDLESLFIMRQATDMFIHVQTTDATNASIKEYLLLDKNCINGAWINYPDIETDNYKPFYTVNNIEGLSDIIIDAYKKGKVEIRKDVIDKIAGLGCKPAAKIWNDFFMSICEK